jgi:hypothetical protein
MSAVVQAGDTLVIGKPVQLFTGVYDLLSETGLSFAVDTKSRRFLMIRPADPLMGQPLGGFDVVLNWASELSDIAADEGAKP